MCGIAGFVDPTGNLGVLHRMTDAIARRGPDDRGHYLVDGVGIGHRRLSIIDVSPLGHQPMKFENLVITFNGEIYNYREIAGQLRELGYDFVSTCDTEVVLKAFHRWGPACVNRFIGMFALAIYDLKDRSMYLIRDRAGVKPLYYYHNDGRLAFGSELKCFKPYLSAQERGDISAAALSEFLSFGYIGSTRSIVASVSKVPPAHYLKFQNGEIEVRRYWDVSFQENQDWRDRTEDDLLDELEALVVSAFQYRMVADVPVGVFLSAGVDSSLVTAVLTKHHGPLKTFTIGFEEKEYDESGDARRIAEHLGSHHHEATLTADKAYGILEHFYDIYDEPHGDGSCIPTTFVSKLAKDSGVKVVLSADAGDELFGGYARYLDFTKRWRQVEQAGMLGVGAGKFLMPVLSALSPAAQAERFNRYAELMREREFIAFMQKMMRPHARSDFALIFPGFTESLATGAVGALLNQMCEWDFKYYMVGDNLVKVDRATMYHSIEGREPFLDHRLVEFAAQLPIEYKIRGTETKYLLKKLLGRYLPERLYRLPKRGFAAPLGSWTRDFYRQQFLDVLNADANPFFDKAAISRLLDRYRSGKPVNYTVLWYLFSFQLWYNKWMAAD